MDRSRIDQFLRVLESELRSRGLSDPEILAEVESHLLDTRDREMGLGLDPEAAQQHALDRFGSARLVARQFAFERHTVKQRILLLAAVLLGWLITYVDTRPTWDDTGITVFALLIGSGMIGLLAERRPWLFALAVGVWLPAWYIVTTHNLSMLIVLAFPFVGVYLGWALRLGLRKVRQLG